MDHERFREITSAFASPTFGKNSSFDVDKPVGSMSISPCGRDVVLASRQGLHIIDLDSPWSPPRHLPHYTPWEVADVQWSPFPSRDYWVVSTSNQKALVWNLAMSTPHASIEHYLHAHSRAITDINFSAHHPDILSTCAVDSFVHCWDLRNPARPAISFCDWFAGATQVKWNRQDPHIIASSHDKFLRIWDDRKGAYPLRSIEAHSTKIYGIDWNRTQTHSIVTCSLDQTIKFWDYSNKQDEPKNIIRTPFPVWRARHTPFGTGLLAMPQRGDNNLYLYDQRPTNDYSNSNAAPVRRFEGHEGQVKEVLWRPRGSIEKGIDNREFQLVSWGSDKVLRLHQLDDETLANVGYERGGEVHRKFNLTRRDAQYKTFREEPSRFGYSKHKTISKNASLELDTRSGSKSVERRNMRIVPTPSAGWVNGGFLNSRPGMRTKTPARKDIDPIAWMRGVKIGKREVGMDQSATSIMSPNYRIDKNWEEFESLGEEIAHVGTKFTKVEYKEIDVQNRFVKFSMHGTWGQNESTKYLECRLQFPKKYPTEAAPIFSVERTASLDDVFISRLKSDVKVISNAYLEFQRSSLEALIRYLHGDQALEDAVAWTKEQGSSILDFAEREEGSSSDEEDEIGGYSGAQNDELGLTDSGVLSSSNANANVPLPKACGAIWAEDGRLVCFFPPKEENPQSLVGSLGLDRSGLMPKGKKRMFGGFGTFHPRTTAKSKASSTGTFEDSDSDSNTDSDSSAISSSNSSNSSRDASSRGLHLNPEQTFRTDIFSFPRVYKGAEEAPKSNESASWARSGPANSKTVISIHKLETLLPSKRTLAQDYIFSGSNACTHNSDVARKAGYEHLAEVWLILDMVLREEVPLEPVTSGTDEGFWGPLAASNPLKMLDSLADVSRNYSSKHRNWVARSAIKWGQHPLGGSVLMPQLLSYFELVADIQMLAMMSCILSDTTNLQILTKPLNLNDSTVRSVVSADSISAMASSPSKSANTHSNYFPSTEVAFSLLQVEGLSASDPTEARRAKTEPSSLASSLGAANSDPVASQSAGITPPSSYKPRRSLDRSDSGHTHSSSPERLRHTNRSSSNLASIAASFSRPFSLSGSTASSPPIAFYRKRTSPVGSYSGLAAQSVTWGATSIFGKPLGLLDEMKSVNTTPEIQTDQQCPNKKDVLSSARFQVSLKNQDQFHNEGYSDTPFLSHGNRWQYQAYRCAYANSLSIWCLPITRAETLKYNGSSPTSAVETGPGQPNGPESPLSIGRRTKESDSHGLNTLRLGRNCEDCGDARLFLHSTSGMACSFCRAPPTSMVCMVCLQEVRGQQSPCLGCGHVLHAACRALLLAESAFQIGGCIIGCGCRCNEQLHVAVEWPINQAPPQRSSAPSTIREASEPEREASGAAGADYEDIAYESLVRNLGFGSGKHAKPKRTHSWKGRERRVNSIGS